MNGTSQNGKTLNFEKMHPESFELNIGASSNRLLADKLHGDGSPVSRSRLDVSRTSPSLDQVVSLSRNTSSNRKSNVTPMKMLIAQEMSKEVDSRRSPPNLVAKLMGLDALPQQETEPARRRSQIKGHSRSHSEIAMSNWEQHDTFFHYEEPNEYKDVYEIWEPPQKFTHMGKYKEPANDKKIAFVREKFVDAKRLSVDGRLCQSKQYQDALEVLSSNKDLFLKCLQEPNSVFAQKLYSLPSTPPTEAKRITVLRPSKMADTLNFAGVVNTEREQLKSHPKSSLPTNYKIYDNPTQPTRIVVLKPNLEKIINDKAASSPQSQSARVHNEDFFGDVEDNENYESREIAKTITNQIREKLRRHHSAETAAYSVFPNGYVADESSFSKSDIEYPSGNLSDSEAMSPVSRHSWDYINRLGSPFSSCSFSRASHSPESSVSREAKKRLSERWALMASNGSCQPQRHIKRSSSTLGDMLALSETKKETPPAKERASNEELKDPNNLLVIEQRVNEDVDHSSRSFTRSNSVSVSSSQFGTSLNEENPASGKGKLEVTKDTKAKSVKSSFKGKVSSLFFLRKKKAGKDKSTGSQTKDECSSDRTENLDDDVPDHSLSGLVELSSKASSSGVISPEAQFSASKYVASGNPGENQDHPSPISVLDPPFDLNEHTFKVFPRCVEPGPHGYELPPNPLSSNLLDKSPPIGSVARTLSWDDSDVDTASSYPCKEPLTTRATNEEAQEWYFFVERLLSVTGLQAGEVQSNLSIARWHSPESPLDPSLRDIYVNLNEKKTLHEAIRRQKRSMQKLVFDCVNTVLVELVGCRSGPAQQTTSLSEMLNEVWARMDAWFCGERFLSGDSGDENGLQAEWVVRKEVADKGWWIENLRLERGILGNEIEGDLLEELLQEAVVELTGRL
ncbi:hypothetical protein OROGR_027470 [Orobanche gracilis]